MESGGRRELEREEEDLLERSVKKPKENFVEDATMDEEMQENVSSSKSKESKAGQVATGLEERVSPGRKLVSYRDIVLQLNGADEDPGSDEESWMEIQRGEEEEDGTMDEDDLVPQEDPLCPVYHFSLKQHKENCKRWRSALIIKLMGKKVNNKFLISRLLKMWCLVGKFEVIDLENGYILINLHNDQDYYHVLHEGPWIVVDHYMVVQRWRPMFDPFDDQFKCLAV